ncbi:discs large MAGUK scaffold protein 5, transcript variant X3 [Ictidomys tridecemlineatus]|uniref:Disks large homolog 5 n=1 Tax=Ictidomys tridecemlineatus TaxID=43179 RepID=I3NDT1_ICTTR|nr:disks large homolog 5 isoform X3 [Ictidomys tridecemlineatus]KAG3264610.1 discs large MAGUK scaffold protein 5, transcript variant X3 [Ictidomys tridecemlineatus]
MEPQRRELLAQCQQSLAQAMTEVEAVLGLLEAAGALSPGERRQLDEEAGGAKAELLLKLLLAKERDHFQDLRAALEKTQPHLLPILYLNGVVGPPQPAEGAGSTYSVLSIMPSDSESSSSLSSVGTTGKAPSPPPLLTDRQANEKVENLSIQLRLMTRERNELRKRLAFATHGTTFDKRPYHRLNPDYERLKIQCVRAMSDLQSLQNQHTNALKRCEEVAKETDFYHTLHSRLLSDQTQLKDDVDMLRRENGQLLRERNLLQQSWEDMKRLHEEDQKEIGDLRAQQQQVLKHNGSSEILNKLYDTAMDKLEGVKKDYDALRKRYSEKVAIHNSDLSRLEQLGEENQRLLKQTEMLTQQRDTAIQLQHQCALSLRRFEAIHHELNKATAQNKDLQWEMELLQSELTELRTTQVKTAKESEKYKEERDAVYSEYKLIMSERDQVISELDKLQTEVELAESKLKSSTSEKKAASEEMEALRQIKDTVTMDAGRANKEVEILRKQCKALCQELKEALQEADVAKCRRDWAFQERDKIVAERDSIRTLCDNLRRERDRAVSELAEALRSLDDTRKQKNDVSRELKELKEQMESQLEKEARFRQLMAHSSHDSAIDTDSMEWETEVVEFERETEEVDLKALGFDMAEGVNEPCFPGDCGIFVTKVDKGSIADGRLRVNDWLLRINDVDLINKDKKQAIKALLNGEGAINMVVRRRKSLGGKVVTPLHINLSGQKDSGISLESGVYAAAVVPGSPAAKEGSLAVGDRIVAINGIALDNKSLNECESLLRSCQDSLTLSLLKVFPQSSSWSGQSIFENIKDSDKMLSLRTHGLEAQAHHKRNLMQHHSSTQTELFCAGLEDRKEPGPPGGSTSFLHKPFPGGPFSVSPQTCPSTSERSLSSFHSDASGERGYGLVDMRSRRPLLPFETEVGPCGVVEAPLDKVDAEGSNSGGTWPKAVLGSTAGPEKLSVYKKPKQRKSIFDPNTFKRPQTPPKIDYLLPGPGPIHSPQPSKRMGPLTPPKPPRRSDSIKFQHRLETSSESEATLVGSSPSTSPPSAPPPDTDLGEPMHASPPRKARVRIASSYYPEGDGDSSYLPAKKSCDEDLTSQKADELGQKRRRPKSAPSFRPKLAPVVIPAQFLEEQKCIPASGDLSPEVQEWSPYSPGHSSRHGNPPLYPNRPSVGTVPRSMTPSTAVSSILRNPIYTVRSHRVGPCSSPPVPRDAGPQGLPPSVQHQGRLSLDLSHRASSDYAEMRASHGSNSLPSSARLGSSSNLQFKAERIKIPLTPRYPRSVMGSDRGSLSHSECSTPPQSPLNIDTLSTCSQSQTSASTLPRIAVNPASLGERRKDRPYVEEPRHVKVQKGSEPLGISIVSGEKGGIYVSKVTTGSIAHQAGLEYGDQLLEFNGINLRSATEQQARLIIGQQCDTITILAQYNPHMHQLGSHSRSSSHLDPAGAHATLQGSGSTTPEHPSVIDPLMEQDEGPGTPPAKQSTSCSRIMGDANKKTPEPRIVFIKKSQLDLGVHLCGGNLHGVFVAEVEDDSPARGPDGLVPGDLILEYGNLDVRNKTVEEVYVEMLKPKDSVRLKVQYRPEEFTRIKGLPGDSFYIRALYDRLAEVEHELSFRKDDILYVDDTLPQGTFGSWMAWQLDENAQKIQRGQIPSKYVMDQEFSRRLSMSEVKDDSNAAKTLSAAARRSFFRRKHKHKRSGSKDGKDLLALDTFSNDSLPLFEDSVSLAYQRVQKVDCTSLRPVLILGPLLDVVKEMLINEAPGKFCRCPLEVMKASQQAIERGVKDCLFVDYKRRSGHFDVTTVASIKEITEKNRHCLLDVAPHAIERLHHMHIYPIVIFIHYKSAKHIKEQRDPIYLRDKVTQRHSKEQFETAQKIEQEYSRYFTGVVQGGALSSICTQILATVNQEQSKVLWIPACPL